MKKPSVKVKLYRDKTGWWELKLYLGGVVHFSYRAITRKAVAEEANNYIRFHGLECRVVR